MIADCPVTCLASSYLFQRRSNPDPTLDSSYIKNTVDDDLVSKIEFIYTRLRHLSIMETSGGHVTRWVFIFKFLH